MDLTKTYPRSAKDEVGGVMMLARTTDKGKAKTHGDIGEYHYNCPMDQKVFGFLGIDHEEYLSTIRDAKDDAEIEAFAHRYIAKKSPEQIAAFNAQVLALAPEPGSEAETYFLSLREQLAPDRTDITTWPDLLDLDEKRDVPRKAAV